jgi:hypothetical protein
VLAGVAPPDVDKLIAWLSSKEGGFQWWRVARLSYMCATKARGMSLEAKRKHLISSLGAVARVEPSSQEDSLSMEFFIRQILMRNALVQQKMKDECAQWMFELAADAPKVQQLQEYAQMRLKQVW